MDRFRCPTIHVAHADRHSVFWVLATYLRNCWQTPLILLSLSDSADRLASSASRSANRFLLLCVYVFRFVSTLSLSSGVVIAAKQDGRADVVGYCWHIEMDYRPYEIHCSESVCDRWTLVGRAKNEAFCNLQLHRSGPIATQQIVVEPRESERARSTQEGRGI